jgi:hypothetical protein
MNKIVINTLIGVVLAYRLIPARVRGLWKLNGSTSHLALEGLRASKASAFSGAADTWFSGPLAGTSSFFNGISSWLDDPWKGPSGHIGIGGI